MYSFAIIFIQNPVYVKTVSLLTIFLFIFSITNSQNIISDIPLEIETGSTYSVQDENPLNAMVNVAVNARIKKPCVAISYQNKFLIKEVNFTNGILIIPTNHGGFSISTSIFGNNNFQQSKISFGYGRSLGRSIEMGIAFHNFKVYIPQYNNLSLFTNELGLILHLDDKITVGLAAFNPLNAKFKYPVNSALSSRYRTGLGYRLSEDLLFSFELIKEESRKPGFSPGINYNFHHKFYFSTAFSFPEAKMFIAAGVHLKNIRINATMENHPVLGLSPGITCFFWFKKNSEL